MKATRSIVRRQLPLALGLAALLALPVGMMAASAQPRTVSEQQLANVVDSDSNNPQTPHRSNNITEAQPIPNPATINGYVNKDGGDALDVYRVELLAGDALTLKAGADGSHGDLNLVLFDSSGTLVDVALGQGATEMLKVSKDGEYLVAVQATGAASGYTLVVGKAPEDAELSSLRLSSNFVAGEAVVKFRNIASSSLGALAQSMGLTAKSQGEARERNRLVTLTEQRQLQASVGTCTIPSIVSGATHVLTPDLQTKLDTLCMVKRLNQDPDVEVAAPNYIRKALFVPNDTYYEHQWHYPQISLPQAWDITTGNNAIVAVIDTGLLFGHPDLQGQLLPGYDFISDPDRALDGDGIDPDPTDVGDRDNDDGSSSFHGTHVAGTVAAATNNGLGVAGVAFTAKVMPLRVLGLKGEGTDYDIEQAMRYAAGLTNDSGTVPLRRADVINLSLGGESASPTGQSVCDLVRAQGVIIVAAAGNEATSTKSYPAAHRGVIAVSATTSDNELASFSNYGSWITVAAPGENILSTLADDKSNPLTYNYDFSSGTSMAAPHVAGVMALMKSVAPNLTPQQVDNLIASGALTDDIGASGRDNQFGYGLINAHKAVLAASGNPLAAFAGLVLNGDYNGDGKADLIWHNRASGDTYGMLLDGLQIIAHGSFYHEPNTAWQIVQSGDFQGQGYASLLWWNRAEGWVYHMTVPVPGRGLTGTFIYHEPNTAWQIVAVGDLNADGRDDLIWWNDQTGQVWGMLTDDALLSGLPAVQQGQMYQETNTNWRILAARDFNGDGRADLLWRNQQTGEVYLMLMDGLRIVEGRMIYVEPRVNEWNIVAVGDLNGDGKADLVWWNSQSGMVWGMLMDGFVIAQQGSFYQEQDTNWRVVSSGDYNGDGRYDLLWRHQVDGRIYQMPMNGLAAMPGAFIYQEANPDWRIVAGVNDDATGIPVPSRALSGGQQFAPLGTESLNSYAPFVGEPLNPNLLPK